MKKWPPKADGAEIKNLFRKRIYIYIYKYKENVPHECVSAPDQTPIQTQTPTRVSRSQSHPISRINRRASPSRSAGERARGAQGQGQWASSRQRRTRLSRFSPWPSPSRRRWSTRSPSSRTPSTRRRSWNSSAGTPPSSATTSSPSPPPSSAASSASSSPSSGRSPSPRSTASSPAAAGPPQPPSWPASLPSHPW